MHAGGASGRGRGSDAAVAAKRASEIFLPGAGEWVRVRSNRAERVALRVVYCRCDPDVQKR